MEERPDQMTVDAEGKKDETVEELLVEAEAAEEAIEEVADAAAAEVLAEGIVEAAEIGQAAEEAIEEIHVAATSEGLDQAETDAETDAVVEAAEEAAADVLVEAAVEAAVIEVVADEAIAEIEEAVAEAVVEEAVAEVQEAVAEAVVEEAVEEAVAEEEEAPKPASPFDGPGDWYVVHTYAGYENRVKTNLASRIQTMQMQDKIFDVVIPMEDVMELKGGKKQVVKKKVFPGYLLVQMIYDNDSWYVVRNTPGVTGFVSAGTGTKPTPLSRREVEKILVVKEEEVKPTFRLEFEEGDVVRIISGPFADFNGTISEINVDQSKLKVLVNIFDRETPVELGFDQVAKV